MVKTRLPYNEEILVYKSFFSGTYHLDTLHSITFMTETHIYYNYFKEKKKLPIQPIISALCSHFSYIWPCHHYQRTWRSTPNSATTYVYEYFCLDPGIKLPNHRIYKQFSYSKYQLLKLLTM